MQEAEEIAMPSLKEEEIYANASLPTSTNISCPGANSNTEGVIPKGGCSTKPTVAIFLKKSIRLYNSVGGTIKPVIELQTSLFQTPVFQCEGS